MDQHDLSGPPEQPDRKPQTPGQPSGGFDFNRPTVVSLLYLSSFILGVTAIVGVVLAYVWKGEPHAEWESSHYTYRSGPSGWD